MKMSSSTRFHLTQEEAAKEALAIRISQRYALLEEERLVTKTMTYNDKYKKILDEIWKDKVELDEKTVKEDEEAVRRIKGEALKEKDDPGAFIFLIRLEGKVNENTEAIGKHSNVLCQVRVTTIIVKFLILDIPIDRDAPIMVGRVFLHTMGSILNTSERIFSTFDGICHQTFRATRFDVLRTAESDSDDKEEYTLGTHDEEVGSSRSKRQRQHEIVEEDVLNQMGCDGEINDMLRISVREAESEEEIFTLSKKIIKFRLGGRAHNLTLLEFARRLGLYQALELEEDDFSVYFEGGLCSDDNFNATDYWLSIGREENLSLSRSHTSTIRRLILRVIYKMITYGLCQRTIGYDKVKKNDLWLLRAGTQKESQIFYGQFISKLARKCRVLTKDAVRSLSALIYCKDLDTTTFRDLVDSDGKLILEDPQQGVPRVCIPRPPRASIHDLYDRMGRMETRQEAIERMKEPTTHLVTLIRNMTSTISSIHLHHSTSHNISSSRMMTSSIEMAQVCRDHKLTTTFITFRVEKEVKTQEVGVASVTIVNYWFTFKGIISCFVKISMSGEFPIDFLNLKNLSLRSKVISGKFPVDPFNLKNLSLLYHQFEGEMLSSDLLAIKNLFRCIGYLELVHPGKNVGISNDHTIFSLIDGLVKFEKFGPDKKKALSGRPRDLYALKRYVGAKDRTNGTNDEESEFKLAQLEDQLPSNEPLAMMNLVVNATFVSEDDEETRVCKILFLNKTFFMDREIVDWPTQSHKFISRYYKQPQRVFNCINARIIPPTKDYRFFHYICLHLLTMKQKVMGEDWQEVPSRNHRRFNADDVSKVAKSVFVTNFPESVSAQDLWKSCSVYGTVVDVFIQSKKSKAGKRFAFVRFIKVFNLDRIVKNLCTIWIGRYHLYANSVRFERSHKSFSAPTANAAEVSKK
nr:pescadillo-like protein [Tanacetum cinerariifolium]